MPKVVSLFSILLTTVLSFAQSSIILSFDAMEQPGAQTLVLDSVAVRNVTNGSDTLLAGPNPALVLVWTGLEDPVLEYSSEYVSDPVPNPNKGSCRILFGLDRPQQVLIQLAGINGTVKYRLKRTLDQGDYEAEINIGSDKFNIISIITESHIYTKQVLSLFPSNRSSHAEVLVRRISEFNQEIKHAAGPKGFSFNPGDSLVYYGYVSGYSPEQISARPTSSQSYTFLFQPAPGFSCGDTMIDARDGKQYSTIGIGTQCWMKENLNIGIMVHPSTGAYQNSTIEKFCAYHDQSYCDIYGGLYDWEEALDYSLNLPSQGICPPGWHIPTELEWIQLESTVDSYWEPDSYIWKEPDYHGYDAAIHLKDTNMNLWTTPILRATNESGFSVLPAGSINHVHVNGSPGWDAWFLSSTCVSSPGVEQMIITGDRALIRRETAVAAASVRCVYDSIIQCLDFPSPADGGPDFLNVQADSVNLQGSPPLHGNGHWYIFDGAGGWFSDPENPVTTFYGNKGIEYKLRWRTFTYCETSWDTVLVSFAGDTGAFQCGMPYTDPRDGQVYHTVHILDMCWMGENLNYGTMIPALNDQMPNSVAEKYCVDDREHNCGIYGAYYQWGELMNYSSKPGAQGLCPPSWHVPKDVEWSRLEGAVDSVYGVGDPIWNQTATVRGYDVGKRLKSRNSKMNMQPYTGSDDFGFSIQLGGSSNFFSGLWPTPFSSVSKNATIWTSSMKGGAFPPSAWLRGFSAADTGSGRGYANYLIGANVRCLYDSILPCTPQPDSAMAGADTIVINQTNIVLDANQPTEGTGLWAIISGSGGSIANPESPGAILNGMLGETYILQWEVSNQCDVNVDNIEVSFICSPHPIQAQAGPDTVHTSATSIQLFANTPPAGQGNWTLISGNGGVIQQTSNPNSMFTGEWNETYLLEWEIATQCGATYDTIEIEIQCAAIPDTVSGGPDSLGIVADSLILNAEIPNVGTGHWRMHSGYYGSISDTLDANAVLYGYPGMTYVLLWVSTNLCNKYIDTVTISFAPIAFSCGDTLVDIRDGKNYPTVLVGNQCWMAKNLDLGVMVADSSDHQDDGVVEKYCLDDNPLHCQTYGGLYQWGEVMDYSIHEGARGICPFSWHIPSDDEWKIAEGNIDTQYGVGHSTWNTTGYRGLDIGIRMKDSTGLYWIGMNIGTNASGLTVLGSGFRTTYHPYTMAQDTYAYLWTSTGGVDDAYYRFLSYLKDNISRGWSFNIKSGFALRCIKD